MADVLYGKDVRTINDHPGNVYEVGEPMTTADWFATLDAISQFNERNILTCAGSASQAVDALHGENEFGQYESERRRLEAASPSSDIGRLLAAGEQFGKSRRRKAVRGKKP